MNRNIFLVARHEFLTNVRKKSFLFAVFGAPILIGVIYAIVLIAGVLAQEKGLLVNTLGYVDEAGILVPAVEAPTGWVQYPDQDSVQTALEAEEIDAFFLITEEYLRTGEVSVTAYGTISNILQRDIGTFLLANLTQQLDTSAPPERLHEPVNNRLFLENTGREMTEEGLIGLIIIPMIFAVILMMALQLSSTFLMTGVAEEKRNHIMEILISSITPYELLSGKLLGLGSLGLIQMSVWVVLGAILFALGGDSEWLAAIEFPPDVLLLALVYFVLTYFMYAGLLAGLGAVIGSEQESRQYASILLFPVALPFLFFSLFLTNPESPILVILTLLPMTSAMTVMLRLPFGVVPFWQIGLSLVLQAMTTVLFIWASGKIFRWALLLSGKPVGIRTLWNVIWMSSPDAGIIPEQHKEGVR